MHELVFLKSLVILLGISAVVVYALHRINIPSIVGFLLAGILLGPHGLHFIKDVRSIQLLAEIGVILLLFTIGLEFSLTRFLKMRLEVFGIGGLQVLITVCLTSFIAYTWFGITNMKTAVFLGFLVSLSSTAIVMKLLSDKAEVDTTHGRISVGILIFQDLCVVPFMLFIPILSGGAEFSKISLAIVKAVAIIVVVVLSSRWIVPNLLHQIVRTRSRELFVITVLIICFGIAFITSEFGLSLALGAFLAGLVISESEFSQVTASTILPFRDSFNGLFFISVGMLMDTSFFIDSLLLVLLIFGGIIVLKTFSSLVSMLLMRRSFRISMHSSLILAQVGEFSFVLAVAGLSAGLISSGIYQNFLSASILTMLLTPFMIQAAPFLSSRLSSHRLLARLENIKGLSEHGEFPKARKDHTIITGFGLNGRTLAKVLKDAGIPYAVLDVNIDTVRHMKRQGEPIFYGDAAQVEVLNRLGIKTARVLVVAISDPSSCRDIVKLSRIQNPGLYIIARTRYSVEVDELLQLGADDVIPEEFETSIEIFSRVLTHYKMPRNEIFNFIDIIRENGYKALRQPQTPARERLFDSSMVRVAVELFTIRDDSPVLDKSIEELQFRTKTGATILAIERNNYIHSSPDPAFRFQTGDLVYITGKREDMNRSLVFLKEGKIDS